MIELRRPRWRNWLGDRALDLVERRDEAALAKLRASLWRRRAFLVVLPGPELTRRALAGYPREVSALCAGARVLRYAARGGGAFYADRNEIWLAAGVETYEGRRQVLNSARHELFHYVCWNHPVYRADEDRGFPRLLRAIAASRPHLHGHPRYLRWVTDSFIPQGDHANLVEYFADIPTNFREPAALPPPIASYFARLIGGVTNEEPDDGDAGVAALRTPADFHRLLVGAAEP